MALKKDIRYPPYFIIYLPIFSLCIYKVFLLAKIACFVKKFYNVYKKVSELLTGIMQFFCQSTVIIGVLAYSIIHKQGV